jgi:ATP-dependent protease HslVU (ClpYQ) peptidase subunit
MTTILGVEYRDGFVIAADSQTTERDRPYEHPDIKKIVEVGDYVIAGAGTSVLVDVFQAGNTAIHASRGSGKLPYDRIVSEFIPELRKLHSECGYIPKDDDSFQFIIGLEKSLFYISNEYVVLRTKTGIYSAGSGGEIALGAYVAGATVQQAVKIAARFDINTSGKVQIVKRGKQDA